MNSLNMGISVPKSLLWTRKEIDANPNINILERKFRNLFINFLSYCNYYNQIYNYNLIRQCLLMLT